MLTLNLDWEWFGWFLMTVLLFWDFGRRSVWEETVPLVATSYRTNP